MYTYTYTHIYIYYTHYTLTHYTPRMALRIIHSASVRLRLCLLSSVTHTHSTVGRSVCVYVYAGLFVLQSLSWFSVSVACSVCRASRTRAPSSEVTYTTKHLVRVGEVSVSLHTHSPNICNPARVSDASSRTRFNTHTHAPPPSTHTNPSSNIHILLPCVLSFPSVALVGSASCSRSFSCSAWKNCGCAYLCIQT
jgi:hypothetical protein